jgi:hypothetical protein
LKNCPNIKSLPNFKYLHTLTVDNLPLLTTIPFYKVKLFGIYNCKNIQYLPTMYIDMYQPIAPSRFEIYQKNVNKYNRMSKSYSATELVIKLYNNIASLWKQYKLKKYVLYLNQYMYSNPSLPYMKYYIENGIYYEQTEQTRVGFINSKNKLIWLTFKSS